LTYAEVREAVFASAGGAGWDVALARALHAQLAVALG
jgi:hypothetical protein